MNEVKKQLVKKSVEIAKEFGSLLNVNEVTTLDENMEMRFERMTLSFALYDALDYELHISFLWRSDDSYGEVEAKIVREAEIRVTHRHTEDAIYSLVSAVSVLRKLQPKLRDVFEGDKIYVY